MSWAVFFLLSWCVWINPAALDVAGLLQVVLAWMVWATSCAMLSGFGINFSWRCSQNQYRCNHLSLALLNMVFVTCKPLMIWELEKVASLNL